MKAKVLEHGGILVTNDRVYIGGINNQPMEVITMAHELNIGTINGNTPQELIDYLIDQLLENKIGNEGKYNGQIGGDIILGNAVTMGGYTWRVCHIDESAGLFYLILNSIDKVIKHGSGIYTYTESVFAKECKQMSLAFSAEVSNILKVVTVEGVTSNVFIPTREQVNGGFSLFSSDESRIAYLTVGADPVAWVTSSYVAEDQELYIVRANGKVNTEYPEVIAHDSYGFRPCVCIALQ